VTRLILLCERPRHLARDEAVAWFTRATGQLAASPGVRELLLTELESASLRWTRTADWMVEAELERDVDPRRLVDTEPWRDLLADLRLLGMRPSVAVADPERVSDLRPDG
jgi:hypothetical protein